jgi:hypothetical protein
VRAIVAGCYALLCLAQGSRARVARIKQLGGDAVLRHAKSKLFPADDYVGEYASHALQALEAAGGGGGGGGDDGGGGQRGTQVLPCVYVNAPGRWDVMISYTQRNASAKLLAAEIYARCAVSGELRSCTRAAPMHACLGVSQSTRSSPSRCRVCLSQPARPWTPGVAGCENGQAE